MSTEFSYVGYCEKCGKGEVMVIDYPEMKKGTAKEVAKMIRAGLVVKRVSTDMAKKDLDGCQCGSTSHEDFIYIGICEGCGTYVRFVVDVRGFEKDTAKEVADMIARGMRVERISRKDMPKTISPCTCSGRKRR